MITHVRISIILMAEIICLDSYRHFADLIQRLIIRIKSTDLADGIDKQSDFTQLTSLSLKDNQLTNVKGLENLTQLTNLNLQENKLTSVKSLEKLTQLPTLELRRNRDLTKAQIAELQKALPKCDIRSNPKK